MSFKAVERFERERSAAKIAEREAAAKLALRRAVRDVIPKDLRVPRRGKGRTAAGGLSRKEVAILRERALRYLNDEDGLTKLEAAVQHTALVILLEDGVLGTEPWRTPGPNGGFVSANARLRYLENAARLLDDLRRRSGKPEPEPRLLEGVITDAVETS